MATGWQKIGEYRYYFDKKTGALYTNVWVGKYYVNDGTWVDYNGDTDDHDTTRTFTVITTGDKDTVGLYKYEKDGTITDIGTGLLSK